MLGVMGVWAALAGLVPLLSVGSATNCSYQVPDAGGHVTLPNDLTLLLPRAFSQCSALRTVSFGSALTYIGEYAFAATGLVTVSVPGSVNVIATGAFASCFDMVNASIGTDVNLVMSQAFVGCKRLAWVYLPNPQILAETALPPCFGAGTGFGLQITPLDMINTGATFGNVTCAACAGKASISFPSTITAISDYSLSHCDLETVTIPESVNVVGEGAFANNSRLQTVHFPPKFFFIFPYAFASTGLSGSITFPNSLQAIGEAAFQHTQLESVELPWRAPGLLLHVGVGAFENTPRLISVAIPSTTKLEANAFDGTGCPNASVFAVGYTIVNCTQHLLTRPPSAAPTAAPTRPPSRAPTSWCTPDPCDRTSSVCNPVSRSCSCRPGFYKRSNHSCGKTSDEASFSLAVGTAVAAVIVVVAIAWLVWRCRRKTDTTHSTDFSEVHNRLFAAAGLGSPNDVAPDEIGLTLTLDSLPRAASQAPGSALDPGVTRALLAALAAAVQGPAPHELMQQAPLPPPSAMSGSGTESRSGRSRLGWSRSGHSPATRDELDPAADRNAQLQRQLQRQRPGQDPRDRVGAAVSWVDAAVRVVAPGPPPEVIVVVKRPLHDPSLRVGDAVHDRVALAIAAHRLHFQCGSGGARVRVTSVALMLSRRVPREVDRQTILRLGQLGRGSTSVVWRAQIKAANGRPPLPVALKEPRDGSAITREDMEREAALIALLEHDNVVKLVGVVTIPAEMPAMLILEYCEGGSLDEHLRERRGIEDTPSMMLRLSFCVDIASGLEFLASHRVVHRDMAARNVLLDAAMSCKVSDFGMSVLLPTTRYMTETGEYLKEYVRIQGHQPIRWCSVEVLTDNCFSTASDVWGYGVTVWEIMSDGATPHGEITNLGLIAEWIKNGSILSRPPACPLSVYTQMIVPCWDPAPSERPSFAELVVVGQSLGGVIGDHRVHTDFNGDSARTRGEDNLTDTERYPTEFWDTPDGLKLRGVSVQHLAQQFLPASIRATAPRPCISPAATPATIASAGQNRAAGLTVKVAVGAYVKPTCEWIVCRRDGFPGCAYVDTLAGPDHVGPSAALLSYSWSYKLVDVVDALTEWVAGKERDPARTYIWICALCLNQHRLVQTLDADRLAAEFGPRVTNIGRILPLLAPWDKPVYVSRAWCLYELFTAVRSRREVQIDIILPPTQRQAFLAAMQTGNYGVLEAGLDEIRSEEATATEPRDLAAIQGYVADLPGGFQALDETVRGQLRRWFEGQGAVLSSARVQSQRRSASQRATSSESVASFNFFHSLPGGHVDGHLAGWGRPVRHGSHTDSPLRPHQAHLFPNPGFILTSTSQSDVYEDDSLGDRVPHSARAIPASPRSVSDFPDVPQPNVYEDDSLGDHVDFAFGAPLQHTDIATDVAPRSPHGTRSARSVSDLPNVSQTDVYEDDSLGDHVGSFLDDDDGAPLL